MAVQSCRSADTGGEMVKDKKHEPMEGFKHFCPICGKEFWAQTEWIYKKSKRIRGTYYTPEYYCSWKCFRKTEKVKT